MGAAHVHVHQGLFPARAEEAWLWEDGDAGEPLLRVMEPALHRRVAVPAPQRPVGDGSHGEVGGMDVGRGVGHAQGRVPLMRRCVAELCLVGDRTERPHGGGPQFQVTVTAGNDELGVAGARQPVPQDGVLRRFPGRLVQQRIAVVGSGSGKPQPVPGMLPAHARAVLKPLQGHLVDCLRRARMDPCGPLVVRVPQEVEDDLSVHCMDPQPVDAVLQGEGGCNALSVGYRARDGHRPRAGEVGSKGDTGGVPAGPASRRVGRRVAPGFRDPILSSGAEQSCFEGGRGPFDVGVAGGQLVYAHGQSLFGRVARWSWNKTSAPVTVLAQDRSAIRCSRTHAGLLR